jgi:hypothetical protein
MASMRYTILALSILGQTACDSAPVSPRANDNGALAPITRTLQGPNVVRRPPDRYHEDTARIVLRGTRMANGCDYSYEHTMHDKGVVTGWIAEYDPTTCDFVIALGRYTGPAQLDMTGEASLRDTAYAAQGELTNTRTDVSHGSPGFHVVTPFMRAAWATKIRPTRSTPAGNASVMPSCPPEVDRYAEAWNWVSLVDPAGLRTSLDSVYGEWAFYENVCIQVAIRGYKIAYFTTTQWYANSHGWTSSPFTIPYPYHYVSIENYAHFTNIPFCDPVQITYGDYPHVRIIGFDDATVSFFDDANASGDCSSLLHKDWTHYYNPS